MRYSSFRPSFSIEALETRIAPAVVLANPLADIVAGVGKTGATIDLSKLTDNNVATGNHTIVEFVTNVDINPDPNIFAPGVIRLELYDDATPLTVENFLGYVNSTSPKADYDNTIIHRSEPNFVIQGGGYDASKLGPHIPIVGTIHNESDPLNRPNVRGTIAMAKIGGDPNSASSEWFINLSDNGSLDTTEGGYTVFGQVISGMEYVDAIAALPRVNFGGAFSTLPTQNYDPDPDDNPSTPSPIPTVDQFVRIVDAKVVPIVGNSAGVTYSLENIAPVDTNTPATLVTGQITGTTLALEYAPGASGRVDVTVKATSTDGSFVTDTFEVDVRPNLLVDIDSTTLPGLIIPGDTATMKFHLTNNGAALASGKVNVQFALVKVQPTFNPNGSMSGFGDVAGATPVSLGTLSNLSINLASGKTVSLTQKFTLATDLVLDDTPTQYEGVAYRLTATVSPVQGDILKERYSDDNSELLGSRHLETNHFGSFTTADLGTLPSAFGFGSRTNASLTYIDSADSAHRATFSIKGAGTGSLDPLGDALGLRVTKTDISSVLAAKLGKGAAQINLARMQFDASVGTANLSGIDLQGTFAAAGGSKSLTLGNVTDSTILLGVLSADNSARGTVKLGRVTDLNFETLMPLTTLTAVDWLDADDTKDSILASAVGALKITGSGGNPAVVGNFEADVRMTDEATTSSLTIAGLVRNATIRTAGNISTATFGGMANSDLFVGLDTQPNDLGDFREAHSIQSFTIKGITGATNLFTDSNVAAQTIGTIALKGVNTANGAEDFGFIADVIKKYSRSEGATVVKQASNVTAPGVIEDVGAFRAEVL